MKKRSQAHIRYRRQLLAFWVSSLIVTVVTVGLGTAGAHWLALLAGWVILLGLLWMTVGPCEQLGRIDNMNKARKLRVWRKNYKRWLKDNRKELRKIEKERRKVYRILEQCSVDSWGISGEKHYYLPDGSEYEIPWDVDIDENMIGKI